MKIALINRVSTLPVVGRLDPAKLGKVAKDSANAGVAV
jgi:hypothetical protein